MIRLISHVDATAPAAPGFIGEGHTAVEVVHSTALAAPSAAGGKPWATLATPRPKTY
jgi:hypothetical protein